jgi:two-component sensor histidine kinase
MNLIRKTPVPQAIELEIIFPYIEDAAFIYDREGRLVIGNEKGYTLINPTRSLDFNLNIIDLSPTLKDLNEWRMLLSAPVKMSQTIQIKLNAQAAEATLISAGKEASLCGLIILSERKINPFDLGKEAIRIAENIGKNMVQKRKEGIQDSLLEIGEYLQAKRLSVLQLNRSQKHSKVVFDQIFTWVEGQHNSLPIIDTVVFDLKEDHLKEAITRLHSGKITELEGFISEPTASPLSGKTILIPILIDEQFKGALVAEISAENFNLPEIALFPLRLLSCAMGLWIDRGQEVSQQTILLKEKETILAELHHRSKNNLAILSGFLDLFEESNRALTAKELSRNMRERIQALALIYEVLSSSSDLTQLSIQKYLELLAFRIESSLGESRKVKKRIQAENLHFRDINQMITVGLLINEIYLNAYHHGLQSVADPQLTSEVRLIQDTLEIHIQDNGPGLPKNWDSDSLPDSIGFTIIKGLSKQLKSTLEVDSTNGCSILLKIKGLDIMSS